MINAAGRNRSSQSCKRVQILSCKLSPRVCSTICPPTPRGPMIPPIPPAIPRRCWISLAGHSWRLLLTRSQMILPHDWFLWRLQQHFTGTGHPQDQCSKLNYLHPPVFMLILFSFVVSFTACVPTNNRAIYSDGTSVGHLDGLVTITCSAKSLVGQEGGSGQMGWIS